MINRSVGDTLSQINKLPVGHTDMKITHTYAKEIMGDENPYGEKLISSPFKKCPKRATNDRRSGPESLQDELVASDSDRPEPALTRQAR